MKKRDLLAFLLLLLICGIVFVYSASVGINLQIADINGPAVNLSVINNSGSNTGNITFHYNVSDPNAVSNCSLVINKRTNRTERTISRNSRISIELNNTAVGLYNWSINCTDELGNTGNSPEMAFSVILMSSFNGSTTNLSAIDVRSITNFVLETTTTGKINFSQNVDISQGYDLNTNVNISSNKIALDSNAVNALNKSAALSLYGLSFSDPRPLRDNSECPSTICTEVSYSSGTYIFNVNQFTVYSSEETPTQSSGSSGSSGGGSSGGGGGGGGAQPVVPVSTDFNADKSSLKVVLRQGQTKEESLSIKNTGNTIFDVSVNLEDTKRFKTSPESSALTLTLNPEEEKTISLVFKALENEKPDVYSGKIILKGPSKEKEVLTVFEVESVEPLFDVDVEVLAESEKVFPGKEIVFDVTLINVRGFGRVDVNVEYYIKDFKGNVISREEETLAVETQTKFTRSVLVPSDVLPGTYVAFVKVLYGDSVGISSDLFEVTAPSIRLYPIQVKDYMTILIYGGITLIAIVLIASAFRLTNFGKKSLTKKEETKQLKLEITTKQLQKELQALGKAYKSGMLAKESYQKHKQRVQEKLNKLK